MVRLSAEPTLQPGVTAGIDRIDQRALPLSGSYSYVADGSGVRAYILDTGLNSCPVVHRQSVSGTDQPQGHAAPPMAPRPMNPRRGPSRASL